MNEYLGSERRTTTMDQQLILEVKTDIAQLMTKIEFMNSSLTEIKADLKKNDSDMRNYVDKKLSEHCEDTEEYIEIAKTAQITFARLDKCVEDVKVLKTEVYALKNAPKDIIFSGVIAVAKKILWAILSVLGAGLILSFMMPGFWTTVLGG